MNGLSKTRALQESRTPFLGRPYNLLKGLEGGHMGNNEEILIENFKDERKTSEMTSGLKLLWRFVHAVDNSTAPSAEDMKALAVGFKAILEGETPKKALSLSGKQSQGRPKRSFIEESTIEAKPVMEVEYLRRYWGKTKEDAISIVSEGPPVIPVTTLERYHKKHRKTEIGTLDMMEWAICLVAMKDPDEIRAELRNEYVTIGNEEVIIGKNVYRHPGGLNFQEVLAVLKKEILEIE